MFLKAQSLRAHVAAVSGIVSLFLLGAAPAAAASSAEVSAGEIGVRNWDSYLSGVYPGFQSRRWEDNNYSEVRFTGCDTDYINPLPGFESTDVELRQDISLQPDRSWGTKEFTACFNGSTNTSRGEWTGLASGDHFFQIDLVNNLVNYALDVDRVYVDTTLGD
ncbi:hypothetical protein ACTWP5_02230 [Streptomyces sp. 4N509B]|uniref:hypothetical protein n=1 Tax=Streptomyces sp. 4N509B TaxID=3457413 RepID=UPI003FD106F7